MSTETPMTDAFMRNPDFQPHNPFQWRDHARSLERRNSELTARISELEKAFQSEINSKNIAVNKWVGRLDEAESALAEARKDSAWQPIATLDKSQMQFVLTHCNGAQRALLWNPRGYWEHPFDTIVAAHETPTEWMELPENPATPLPETKEGQL